MMYKICLLLFSLSISTNHTYAQSQSFQKSINYAYHSEHFLSSQNKLKSSDKGILKFGISNDTNSSSSKLVLNYDGYNNFTFDGSYLEYSSGIATFGVGTIDRNWSFSKNTSLILSHNARPTKTIYLKLKNRFGYDWLPSKANWSFEIFNGFSEGSLNDEKSMLIGARAVLSPFEGLDFELTQASQLGGKGYDSGISAIGAALFFDTNEGSNSNINKMAGFGVSYLIPISKIPLRIYGQLIGEDEAGYLPSCYSYLAGLEWSNTKIKYPTTIGIEVIDTRIDRTTHGYCGPNTMYNNSTYKYINYGKTMGAEIDTESNSLELFGQSQVSQKIDIQYSLKYATINDNNWGGHRLSSKKQSGSVNSIGASWSKNNIKFSGNIYFQGFTLDKANIKNGYGAGFSSSVIF